VALPIYRTLASFRTHVKRALAVVGLLGLISVSLYFGFRSVRKDSHFRAAQKALEADDLPRARQELQACLKSERSSPEVLFLLARTERRLSLFQAAQEHLASYLRRGGEPELVQLERLLQEAQRGHLEASEATLLDYVAKDHPDSVIILEALVKGYVKEIRPDEAVACADKWLKQQPDSALAWFLRGKGSQGRTDYDDALRCYRRAVALAPANGAARLLLAEQLLKANQAQEALEHYLLLNQEVPDDPKVLLGMARVHFALAHPDEVRKLLNQLLAKDSKYVPAVVLLARVEQSLKAVDKAERWFRKALDLDPFEREAMYGLAQCLSQQGKRNDAASWHKRLRALDEDVDRRNRFIAVAARNPKDPHPRCEAGKLSLKLGKDGAGVRFLEAALRVNPQYGPAHRALAEYYHRIGQAEAAALHERALANINAPVDKQ
jgi:tetratricopeptide (TPR) repeat protein